MVAATPEQIRDEAVLLFKHSELPEAFAWVGVLSPVHLRLFVVELSDALKDATITGDLSRLVETFADWQATAEMDASPELWAEVSRAKERKPIEAFLGSA